MPRNKYRTTNSVVDFFMELQTVTSANMVSSRRNEKQSGRTYTALGPTTAGRTAECCAEYSLKAVIPDRDFKSSQTQRIPFRSRTTLSHFLGGLSCGDRMTDSEEPPRVRGGPDPWRQRADKCAASYDPEPTHFGRHPNKNDTRSSAKNTNTKFRPLRNVWIAPEGRRTQ